MMKWKGIVASLFLWGSRLWPAITLGTFLVDLFAGASPLVATGTSVGSTLEALVCTALLRRERVRPELDSLHDILVLVLMAAPISAFISAMTGVSSLLLGGSIVWSSVYGTWSAWWLGDVISLFQLTPLLLTWSTWSQATLSYKRLIELGLLSVFILVVGLFVFLGLPHLNQTRLYLLLLATLALITAEGPCENNLRDKGAIWAKVACYDTMNKKEILSRKRISFLQREKELFAALRKKQL